MKRKNKEVRRVTEERNGQVNAQDTVAVFRKWLLDRAQRADQVLDGEDPLPDNAQLQPLVQYALAIEWEIKHFNSNGGQQKHVWRQFVHEIYPWYPQFELLLHSAAVYQSCTEQVQLQPLMQLAMKLTSIESTDR